MSPAGVPQKINGGLGEVIVGRINWKLIALGAIGVLAIANVMLYVRERQGY